MIESTYFVNEYFQLLLWFMEGLTVMYAIFHWRMMQVEINGRTEFFNVNCLAHLSKVTSRTRKQWPILCTFTLLHYIAFLSLDPLIWSSYNIWETDWSLEVGRIIMLYLCLSGTSACYVKSKFLSVFIMSIRVL